MKHPSLTRRQMLATTLPASLGLLGLGRRATAADDLPPTRPITRGPKFHWFGYYDKLQFDPTNRYVLGMEVDFEHRSPKPEDGIRIGMVDLQDGDRWIELGVSHAWGWQQGCMLQWVPGTESTVLWNDRDGDHYVCRILDVRTKKLRTLPEPIECLSPDGKSALVADFRRVNECRPGYGYAGLPDPHRDELTPKDSGISLVDLETGRKRLILSLADLAAFGNRIPDMEGAKHYTHHILFSTDGSRFIFLHRWIPAGKTTFRTRMLTATPDGKDLFVLDGSGFTSHFIWRDPEHILAWTRPFGKGDGFYLFRDRTSQVEQIGQGAMTVNGHCTYLPGNQWILNDTYPDRERLQHPFLYHVATNKRVPLGHFLSPKEYAGEWRCDNHPRFSRDGRLVVVDSPHGGSGRQMHLIDVSRIV
jgi:hypothetical protein